MDRLVRRTVTYALVTGLLVLPYLLVVPVAGRLAAGTGSLGVAAATLAAAAGFAAAPTGPGAGRPALQPASRDAAHTSTGSRSGSRDEVDLDALRAELLTVVDQTVQPDPGVAVAARPGSHTAHPQPSHDLAGPPRPSQCRWIWVLSPIPRSQWTIVSSGDGAVGGSRYRP